MNLAGQLILLLLVDSLPVGLHLTVPHFVFHRLPPTPVSVGLLHQTTSCAAWLSAADRDWDEKGSREPKIGGGKPVSHNKLRCNFVRVCSFSLGPSVATEVFASEHSETWKPMSMQWAGGKGAPQVNTGASRGKGRLAPRRNGMKMQESAQRARARSRTFITHVMRGICPMQHPVMASWIHSVLLDDGTVEFRKLSVNDVCSRSNQEIVRLAHPPNPVRTTATLEVVVRSSQISDRKAFREPFFGNVYFCSRERPGCQQLTEIGTKRARESPKSVEENLFRIIN